MIHAFNNTYTVQYNLCIFNGILEIIHKSVKEDQYNKLQHKMKILENIFLNSIR